jgi:hypothetical protein
VCCEVVRERHGFVALDIVRAEERRSLCSLVVVSQKTPNNSLETQRRKGLSFASLVLVHLAAH